MGRTWRSASTTPGEGALGGDRPRARQHPGGPGAGLRPRGRARPADRAHALPGHDHVPAAALRGRSRVRGQELRRPRVPRRRLPRRQRREPGGPGGGRASPEPRLGGAADRAHAIDAYYQASTAGAGALFRSRGYQDQRDRQPRRRAGHVPRSGRRPEPRPAGPPSAPRGGRAPGRARTATRAGRAPSSGAPRWTRSSPRPSRPSGDRSRGGRRRPSVGSRP